MLQEGRTLSCPMRTLLLEGLWWKVSEGFPRVSSHPLSPPPPRHAAYLPAFLHPAAHLRLLQVLAWWAVRALLHQPLPSSSFVPASAVPCSSVLTNRLCLACLCINLQALAGAGGGAGAGKSHCTKGPCGLPLNVGMGRWDLVATVLEMGNIDSFPAKDVFPWSSG